MSMHNKMKLFTKYAFLFLVGGLVYMGIELIWRQRTHWSMGIVGGLCFVEIGLINEILSWKTGLIKQALLGATLVTVNEFIAGVIINILLGWDVWDYSNLPFNIMGQVCLLFFFLWIFVSIFAIVLDDYLRYRFFGEDRPEYYIGNKHIVPFHSKCKIS